MSSTLPANEQYDRVVALAWATAAEGLSMEEFSQRTAEYAGVGSREKVDLYLKAIADLRSRVEEEET